MSQEIRDKINNAIEEAVETGSSSVTITRPEGINWRSVHGVMGEIKKIVPLTPEQEFRVHAMIKRHAHFDKWDMYEKFKDWLVGGFAPKEKSEHVSWVESILDSKIKTHKDMAHDTDEEICTYDVGSHKYSQRPSKSTDSGLN